MTPSRLVAAFMFALSTTGMVDANDGPRGIAFSYAPEQGAGVCTGPSPEDAFSCATAKCTESGALTEDCAPVAWCFPAGWSAGIGVMHREGIHWSEFTCGWQTRDAALAAGRLRCEQMDAKMIQGCSVGVLYDPDGAEMAVE